MLMIENCSIADIEAAPNIKELLAEYAEESRIKGLPEPTAKVEIYKHLEKTSALHVIGAWLDDILVGYITVLSPVLPHYSALVAVAESFFVSKEHRKTGAGLKLRRAAEQSAKALHSPGLLVSAPFGGDLAEVLPHTGYVETNRVFFKGFSNE